MINEIRFSDLRDEDRFGKKHSDHRQTEEIPAKLTETGDELR